MLGSAMFEGFKVRLDLTFFKNQTKPTKETHSYLKANLSLKVHAIKLSTKNEAEALDDAKIFTYNGHFYLIVTMTAKIVIDRWRPCHYSWWGAGQV